MLRKDLISKYICALQRIVLSPYFHQNQTKMYMCQNYKLLNKYNCTCMQRYTHKYVPVSFSFTNRPALVHGEPFFKITQRIITLVNIGQ